MTTSLVTELSGQGETAFDQDVPQDTPLPYVWLGLGAVDDWDLMDPDAERFQWDIDVEFWGLNIKQVNNRAAQIRDWLASRQPGAFGAGTIAGVKVEDHDESYRYRNIEADERLAVATLRITIFQYLE